MCRRSLYKKVIHSRANEISKCGVRTVVEGGLVDADIIPARASLLADAIAPVLDGGVLGFDLVGVKDSTLGFDDPVDFTVSGLSVKED
jgi:hypothetical protein